MSTGCGPTSSAVWMFEPVTMTRSVVRITCSIVPPAGTAVCGVGATSCANAARIGQKTPPMIARHRLMGFAGNTPATTSSWEYLYLLLEAGGCIREERGLILGREER